MTRSIVAARRAAALAGAMLITMAAGACGATVAPSPLPHPASLIAGRHRQRDHLGRPGARGNVLGARRPALGGVRRGAGMAPRHAPVAKPARATG